MDFAEKCFEEHAQRKAFVASVGCPTLVEGVMELLVASNMNILWLEDNQTMHIVHAVADGAPVFQLEPSMTLETAVRTPRTVPSPANIKALYKMQSMQELAVSENECTMRLYRRLRARYPPPPFVELRRQVEETSRIR